MDSNQSSMAGTRGRLASLIVLCCLLACKMPDDKVLPRNQSLPLFNPHVSDFICEIESNKVPPIDAQAEDWFLEARALEDPEIFVEDRDYRKIIDLTRQAAERSHWKAMLNLASLYVEGRDPLYGEEEAVQLVEKAMRLGVPAAYDRMGTYYANGTGVNGDITRAYAFWQKAAQMGNPQAMDFLSDKLNVGPANEGAGYWANIPVAIKMMECAFSQGYGPVAYNLSYMYASPRMATGRVSGPRTPETKALALKVLHEGVAFGCEKCANNVTAYLVVPSASTPIAASPTSIKSCHCHQPICRRGMVNERACSTPPWVSVHRPPPRSQAPRRCCKNHISWPPTKRSAASRRFAVPASRALFTRHSLPHGLRHV
nr:tetratricopeptide repeat protein [Janthinobacterium sp. GW458P]